MIAFDLTSVRESFPMLSKTMHNKPLIYFDTAATAQKPQSVIDAITHFYQNHYGTVHRAIYELAAHSTNEYQNVRDKVRLFLNAAKNEEIIFTRGTTESINLVAYSFGKAFVKPGDEVLISAMEHHSNIVPWQLMCEDRGAIVKVIPMTERGDINLEEYAKLLNPKTKIVALTHISNSIGTINPIEKMIKMAHDNGAKILIDGAQSTPHMAIDVQKLDADFFVFSGHKLFGPTGIGVLYGKESLLTEMPPYQGGGDMIEWVTFQSTTYNTLPLKFEAGTPMIAEVIGLGAAIDYLNAINLKSIESYETYLKDYAYDQLSAINHLKILGSPQKRGALITFTVDGIHPLDLGTLLDLKGIAVRTGHFCAQPVMRFFQIPAAIRASLAFYNTTEEIDSFCKALEESIAQLK